MNLDIMHLVYDVFHDYFELKVPLILLLQSYSKIHKAMLKRSLNLSTAMLFCFKPKLGLRLKIETEAMTVVLFLTLCNSESFQYISVKLFSEQSDGGLNLINLQYIPFKYDPGLNDETFAKSKKNSKLVTDLHVKENNQRYFTSFLISM